MGWQTDSDRFVSELAERLAGDGFSTIRPEREGDEASHQPPDLLAGFDGRLYLFIVATGQNPERIPARPIQAVRAHARLLGGKPRLALRRYGADWVFLYLDDLREESDHYRIPDGAIDGFGLSIEDL